MNWYLINAWSSCTFGTVNLLIESMTLAKLIRSGNPNNKEFNQNNGFVLDFEYCSDTYVRLWKNNKHLAPDVNIFFHNFGFLFTPKPCPLDV